MFVYLSRDPSNTSLKSRLPVRTRWPPATRWVRVTRKAYTTFTSTPEFKFPPWYANLRHYGQLDEVVAYSLWLWWLLCDYVQLLLVIMCNVTCLCVCVCLQTVRECGATLLLSPSVGQLERPALAHMLKYLTQASHALVFRCIITWWVLVVWVSLALFGWVWVVV